MSFSQIKRRALSGYKALKKSGADENLLSLVGHKMNKAFYCQEQAKGAEGSDKSELKARALRELIAADEILFAIRGGSHGDCHEYLTAELSK